VSFGIFETVWLLGTEGTAERLRRAARRWAEETDRART
jgi:hypothetical protein